MPVVNIRISGLNKFHRGFAIFHRKTYSGGGAETTYDHIALPENINIGEFRDLAWLDQLIRRASKPFTETYLFTGREETEAILKTVSEIMMAFVIVAAEADAERIPYETVEIPSILVSDKDDEWFFDISRSGFRQMEATKQHALLEIKIEDRTSGPAILVIDNKIVLPYCRMALRTYLHMNYPVITLAELRNQVCSAGGVADLNVGSDSALIQRMLYRIKKHDTALWRKDLSSVKTGKQIVDDIISIVAPTKIPEKTADPDGAGGQPSPIAGFMLWTEVHDPKLHATLQSHFQSNPCPDCNASGLTKAVDNILLVANSVNMSVVIEDFDHNGTLKMCNFLMDFLLGLSLTALATKNDEEFLKKNSWIKPFAAAFAGTNLSLKAANILETHEALSKKYVHNRPLANGSKLGDGDEAWMSQFYDITLRGIVPLFESLLKLRRRLTVDLAGQLSVANIPGILTSDVVTRCINPLPNPKPLKVRDVHDIEAEKDILVYLIRQTVDAMTLTEYKLIVEKLQREDKL